MSEEIKNISIGTWITIITIVVGFGTSYGIMQTNLKVIENQIFEFKNTADRERSKQDVILKNLTEQQRLIDANANEIRHMRELRELEKK
jgi:hypothetical protein